MWFSEMEAIRPCIQRGAMRARGWLCAVAIALGLAACGFHPRGEANYPFDSIFVNAPISPPLKLELTRAVAAASKARVVDAPTSADVVLEIPSVIDDKEVLSLSSGGSVREYQLIKRVQFSLHDKEGNDWMTPGEIVVRRSYTFNETQVLARDLQEQRLQREMQTDAIQQIVRRMQVARRP
jgi:LPS-assembly lipoprotein